MKIWIKLNIRHVTLVLIDTSTDNDLTCNIDTVRWHKIDLRHK